MRPADDDHSYLEENEEEREKEKENDDEELEVGDSCCPRCRLDSIRRLQQRKFERKQSKDFPATKRPISHDKDYEYTNSATETSSNSYDHGDDDQDQEELEDGQRRTSNEYKKGEPNSAERRHFSVERGAEEKISSIGQRKKEQTTDDDESFVATIASLTRSLHERAARTGSDSTNCDTIKQLIEQTQETKSVAARLGGQQLIWGQSNTAGGSLESKGLQIGPARRYSSAIWRAVSRTDGGGERAGGSFADDFLPGGSGQFQLHRDSISEAAKRLGRRLSVGGNSLLGRLFGSQGQQSQEEELQEVRLCSKSDENSRALEHEREREREQEQKWANVTNQCDIRVERSLSQENERYVGYNVPAAGGSVRSRETGELETRAPPSVRPTNGPPNNLEARGNGDQMEMRTRETDNNGNELTGSVHLTADVTNLFQSEEFAKRHRQSIAVQSFFTKSIEVNAEDEDEDEMNICEGRMESACLLSPAIAAAAAAKSGSRRKDQVTVVDSDPDLDFQLYLNLERDNKRTTGSSVERAIECSQPGAKQSESAPMEAEIGGNRGDEICLSSNEEEREDDGEDVEDDEPLTIDSTTSGWTAPTSGTTNLESTNSSGAVNTGGNIDKWSSSEAGGGFGQQKELMITGRRQRRSQQRASSMEAKHMSESELKRSREQRRQSQSQTGAWANDDRPKSNAPSQYKSFHQKFNQPNSGTAAACQCCERCDQGGAFEGTSKCPQHGNQQEPMGRGQFRRVELDANSATNEDSNANRAELRVGLRLASSDPNFGAIGHDKSKQANVTEGENNNNDTESQMRLVTEKSSMFMPMSVQLQARQMSSATQLQGPARPVLSAPGLANASSTNGLAAVFLGPMEASGLCRDELSRVNSDFSSFTLITTNSTLNNNTSQTTTTTSSSSATNGPLEVGVGVGVGFGVEGGKGGKGEKGEEGGGGGGVEIAKRRTQKGGADKDEHVVRDNSQAVSNAHLLQQQRRAFSETEAYLARFSMQTATSFEACGLAIGTHNHTRATLLGNSLLNQPIDDLPSDLIRCNPAQIGQLSSRLQLCEAQSSAIRQIKSAELTLDNSLFVSSATSSLNNNNNDNINRANNIHNALGGDTNISGHYNASHQHQNHHHQHNNLQLTSPTNQNRTTGYQNNPSAHRPLTAAPTSSNSVTGTGSIASDQRHNSRTNLIGGGARQILVSGQHTYTRLNDSTNTNTNTSTTTHQNLATDGSTQPVGAGGSCDTRDVYGTSQQQQQRERRQSSAAGARYQQQQQWCHSNTFSSSLNSDISTSGGPKDTTEKDSSRRTSTLSGISSIYQQEISLGLATPHSYGAGGGCSTPANSGATAPCSNMGSIPELAGSDQFQNQQLLQQQQQSGPALASSEPESGGLRAFKRSVAHAGGADPNSRVPAAPAQASPFNSPTLQQQQQQQQHALDLHLNQQTAATGFASANPAPDRKLGVRPAKLEEPSSVKTRAEQEGERNEQSMGGLADHEWPSSSGNQQQFETSSSTSINLQRVAQSLGSQLRERFSTMRSLNAFMGLAAAGGSGSAAVQAEQAGGQTNVLASDTKDRDRDGQTGADSQQSRQASNQHNRLRAVTQETLSEVQQTQLGSPSTPNSLAGQNSRAGVGSRASGGGGGGASVSASGRETPAKFRSFFRSTSSAAFNAFASSFQHQSSSTSTPTATTAIIQQHFSSSSQQFASGSLSSDVFDPPPAWQTSSASPSGSGSGLVGSVKLNSTELLTEERRGPGGSVGQQAERTPPPMSSGGGGGALRSPLSPISVTSARFFARIRDKFSLSPPITNSSPRPNSSISTSTSASLNTIINKQQQQQQQQHQVASNRGSRFDGPPNNRSTASKSDQIVWSLDEQAHPQMEQEPHTQLPNSNTPKTIGQTRAAVAERGLPYTVRQSMESNNDVKSISLNDDMTISELSSTSNSDERRNEEEKEGGEGLVNRFAKRQAAPPISRSQTADSYEADYERVLTSRRPSFQRQLDEQVNQVYRMAVDRKLRNSPIEMSLFDFMAGDVMTAQHGDIARKDSQLQGSGNLPAGGSDLDSIIRPMNSLLYSPTVAAQQLGSNTFEPTNKLQSIYLPAGPTEAATTTYGANLTGGLYQTRGYSPTSAGQTLGYPAQPIGNRRNWIESSQQSIDSTSSSARSLRSCWFSMPELYAMNCDSSSQSPSGIGTRILGKQSLVQPNSSTTMDELLGALSSKLLPDNANLTLDQQQQQQQQQNPTDWLSNQLYKQVTSDAHNWSLSDLNLTSDDIAAPNLIPGPVAVQADGSSRQKHSTPAGQQQHRQQQQQQSAQADTLEQLRQVCQTSVAENSPNVAALMKCSTLDDSICVSMKSNTSTKEQHQANGEEAQLATSAGCSLPKEHASNEQRPANEDNESSGNNNNSNNESRPTSQNSTISSTSYALSDLNTSSDLQELARSPISQQQWPTTAESSSASPLNVSPLSSGLQPSGPNGGPPLAAIVVGPKAAIPQCTIVTSATTATTLAGDLDAAPTVDEPPNQQPQLLALGSQKQRAHSLIPLDPSRQLATDWPSSERQPTAGGGLLTATSGSAATCVPRRRSAMGSLMLGPDVAPAAASLDLRMASRRNRVKLTDLHPITFINDRRFLNSLSSLKKADDGKLNAIFNSPVGRRLSVNAELAQHSPFNQAKSGIKIGLTGYVYMDNPNKLSNLGPNFRADYLRGANSHAGSGNHRRPSLAPNFWRAQHSSAAGDTSLVSGYGGGDASTSNVNNPQSVNSKLHEPGAGGSQPPGHSSTLKPNDAPIFVPRPRAASYTPSPLRSTLESAANHDDDDAAAADDDDDERPIRASHVKARESGHEMSNANVACQPDPFTSAIAARPPMSQPQPQPQNSSFEKSKQPEMSLGGSSVFVPASKGPSSGYLEKRRATMAMLERLSESSVEVDVEGQHDFRGSLEKPVKAVDKRAGLSLAGPTSVSRPSRKSISCLIKIGEDDELRGANGNLMAAAAAAAAATTELWSSTSLSNRELSETKRQQGDGDEYEQLRDHLKVPPNGSSNSMSPSPSSRDDESHNLTISSENLSKESLDRGQQVNSAQRLKESHQQRQQQQQQQMDDSSSSSSDDGDIEKLAAQYPSVVDFQMQSSENEHLISSGNVRQPRQSRSSSSFSSNSDRIVKNEMILKQLLLASNAASLTTRDRALGGDGSSAAAGGGGGGGGSGMRRFSAINIYQRDEDVFVANSMKRPPTSQLQVLNTLPLLAGTLPILVDQNHIQHAQVDQFVSSSKPSSIAQTGGQQHRLPVLSAARAGMKSIITGNSGLNNNNNNSSIIEHNGSRQAIALSKQQIGRTSSISSALVAEVDVEEQLNRLRQQERRSMGFASGSTVANSSNSSMSCAFTNRRNTSPSSAEWTEQTDDDCEPSAESNAFLNGAKRVPPTSDFASSSDLKSSPNFNREQAYNDYHTITTDRDEDKQGARLIAGPSSQLANSTLPFKSTAKSPPNSPTATIASTTASTTTTSQSTISPGAALALQSIVTPAPVSPQAANLLLGRSDPLAYTSGSKSCEPFKQLDTIIEGRGLLLGAEQQADPSYANRLRRLSGNHPRCPSACSVGASGVSGSSSGGASGSNNNINNNNNNNNNCTDQRMASTLDDDWCKCDPSPARKISSTKSGGLNRLRLDRKLGQSRKRTAKSAQTNSSSINSCKPAAQSGNSSHAAETTVVGSSISSSSKYVLDTMRSLARRTLNNLATIRSAQAASCAQSETNISVSRSADGSGRISENSIDSRLLTKANMNNKRRQQRSSSMVVGGSGSSLGANLASPVQLSGACQPTLPSRFLREKVQRNQEAKLKRGTNLRNEFGTRDNYENEDEDEDVDDVSTSSSVTGSADDSSLMSLDDAENYLAKNKANKMEHGRSLESSSSTLSSSSSSATLEELDGDERAKRDEMKLKHQTSVSLAKRVESGRVEKDYDEKKVEATEDDEEVEEEEAEAEAEEDDEDDDEEEEEDEIEGPKICYKCNKGILMEDYEDYYDDDRDQEYDEDEEDEEEFGFERERAAGCELNCANGPDTDGLQQDISLKRDARLSSAHLDGTGKPLRANMVAASAAGSGGTRQHKSATARHASKRRTDSAARRSASMNADEPEISGAAGVHINRRKNKWHIQRNLAPKLKRQRSFSANYAPEVPNPVMPPPRRFSAAPTLSCPHRNKSSSHSSSSLHHTYSIDSSESMITVIPANRGQEFKRTSRGSLSCNSGQGMDASTSFYALPRSPLSPRSPSRCSPGLLTPNTSEPPTAALEPPFSPATTTCSSTGPTTVIQQQTKRPANDELNLDTRTRIHIQSSISSGDRSSCFNLALPNLEAFDSTTTLTTSRSNNLSSILSGEEENLSLAVENGTSYNSSRYEVDEFSVPDFESQTDIEVEEELVSVARKSCNETANQEANNSLATGDPNEPVIRETINDFCARHSREELEFLVGQVGYLKISDCYYSERSSTLCMVIEVMEY